MTYLLCIVTECVYTQIARKTDTYNITPYIYTMHDSETNLYPYCATPTKKENAQTKPLEGTAR